LLRLGQNRLEKLSLVTGDYGYRMYDHQFCRNIVPQVFIFPRARLRDSLMSGTPPGSLGLVNNPQSSWIT
jgi:hypothetical protein